MALRALYFARLAALSACAALIACDGGESDDHELAAAVAKPYPDDPANLELWLDRMEVGSRDIYSARAAVASAVDLKPGARIADIGAGTGVYTMLFAEKVGVSGAVFAVDIEPRFLKLINQRAADGGFENVVSVLGRIDSITLPAQSVDVVFICDTYHYFEDPAAIMATVRASLRPGGALYVVDYELAEGATPPADHRHVRFGRNRVAAEIRAFGFEEEGAISVPGLSDNYMLRFRKPA